MATLKGNLWARYFWGILGLLTGLTASTPLVAQRVDPAPQYALTPVDETLSEYQKLLKSNPQSSLVYYRIGELLLRQRNYQSSANCFRFALQGDGDPAWTKVWSHIQLGKIFDVTQQRDRAINEYRLAVRTRDNTLGAASEAEHLLLTPYKWPAAVPNGEEFDFAVHSR
jgi:tetratricopeptide (TPR) repeat protein